MIIHLWITSLLEMHTAYRQPQSCIVLQPIYYLSPIFLLVYYRAHFNAWHLIILLLCIFTPLLSAERTCSSATIPRCLSYFLELLAHVLSFPCFTLLTAWLPPPHWSQLLYFVGIESSWDRQSNKSGDGLSSNSVGSNTSELSVACLQEKIFRMEESQYRWLYIKVLSYLSPLGRCLQYPCSCLF